jgi:hypothetical protein
MPCGLLAKNIRGIMRIQRSGSESVVDRTILPLANCRSLPEGRVDARSEREDRPRVARVGWSPPVRHSRTGRHLRDQHISGSAGPGLTGSRTRPNGVRHARNVRRVSD